MADSTLDSELFVLYSHTWGIPVQKFGETPKGDFTDSSYQNVAAEKFPLGTSYAVYNPGTTGTQGWSVFTYLKVGTQNPDVAIAVKSACVQDSATDPFIVTNDPDSCIHLPSARVAYALGAVTDAYFAWFWTGGVCPEQLVSTLGGNYLTDSAVIAGDVRAVNLAADAIGLGNAQVPGSAASTANAGACGYALAADA